MPRSRYNTAEQCIWAPIIEKALADQLKSYENFDALNITANEFWKKITGALPGGFKVEPDTALSAITEAAQASTRVPTIGASKDDADPSVVSQFHGFAMLGMQGPKIQL